MQQWNFAERRKLPRYEIVLPASETDLNSYQKTHSITRDICEQGVGIFSKERLFTGTPVEICLKMPDNQEEIFVQGKIAWVSGSGNDYRAGICLDKFDLKPVTMVLRVLKFQLKTRYYE